jgi:uncharacterized membrane protein
MKTKIILIFLFIALSIKSFCQNSLEMYNNTDKTVNVCYAYYDASNSSWSTKGWYSIEKYSSKSIKLGAYTNTLYIYGYSDIPGDFWHANSQISWGNDVSLCIDTKNAFEIRNADKVKCETTKKFSKTTISRGVNKWTFNP